MSKNYNPEQRSWSIMTRTRGGHVSIIRGLTEREAKQAYEKLDPDRGQIGTRWEVHKDFRRTDGIISMGSNSMGSSGFFPSGSDDGRIVQREVFGPPGWEMFEVEMWPKWVTVWVDDRNNVLPDEYQDDVEAAARARNVERATGQVNTRPYGNFYVDQGVRDEILGATSKG